MKAELFKGHDLQWYARLVSGNGRILFVSKGYTRKHNARKAVVAAWRGFKQGLNIV